MDIHIIQSLYEVAIQTVIDAKYNEAVVLFINFLNQTNADTTNATEKNLRLNALHEYAQLMRIIGDHKTALSTFEQYRDESANDHHTVNALTGIGRQHLDMGLPQQAIENNQAAIELATQLNYNKGLGKALANTGYTYLTSGKYDTALSYLQKAAILFERSNDPATQLDNYIYMGVAYHYSGVLDKAIESYQQALQMAQQRDIYPKLIVSLNNIGESYQDLFYMEKALQLHQEALQLIEKYKIYRIEHDVHRNTGIELSYLGYYEKGMAHLQRALTLSQECSDIDVEMNTLYALALTEFRQGYYEVARDHALRLHQLANKQDANHHQAYALHILGLYEQAQAKPTAAVEMWQQAIFLAHEANNRWLLWQIHAAMAQTTGNARLAQTHNRIAIEIIQQIADPIQDETIKEAFLSALPIQTVLNFSS